MRTAHPKLGVFSYVPKYSFIVAFISQLVKKLQQCSLYEVIEDILPFVLNTKRPLSYIWLLSYKQNNFGCFFLNVKVWFFQKHPKLFCVYLSNQISLRGCFAFKTNRRISFMTSNKNYCSGFCGSWDIKATLKLYFGNY